MYISAHAGWSIQTRCIWAYGPAGVQIPAFAAEYNNSIFWRNIKIEDRSFQLAVRVSLVLALRTQLVNDRCYVHTQDWTVLLEDAINTLQVILSKVQKKGILPEHMAWSNIAACVWLLCSTDTDPLTWRAQSGFSHRCQTCLIAPHNRAAAAFNVSKQIRLAAHRKSEIW